MALYGRVRGLSDEPRLCDLCAHRHRGTHPPTCDAFPQRIPLDIRLMYADHRQPYPGDHGIRFKCRDDEESRRELEQMRVRPRPKKDQ